MIIISRQQLEVINKTTLRYPLHIAEKDYFLTLVLQMIASSQLGNTLVFKGGTALHHCYLPQYRFSEDLDFSSGQQVVALEKLTNIFASHDFLKIKKHYQSDTTVKIKRLLYQGPLGHPNSIKVEVDFLQNILLPPQEISYQNVWGLEFTVRTMDVREICAEKIRAVSQRARYRDFYDLYFLINEAKIKVDDAVQLLKEKENRMPVLSSNIAKNWTIAKEEKIKDLGSIYCSKEISDQDMDDFAQSIQSHHFEIS